MQDNRGGPWLGYGAGGPAGRGNGLIARALAIVAGVLVLAATFVFSLVVFSIVLAVGIVAWGYLWWKTRGLRRQMREQMEAAQRRAGAAPGATTQGPWARQGTSGRASDEVIDGEYIREVGPDESSRARDAGTDSGGNTGSR